MSNFISTTNFTQPPYGGNMADHIINRALTDQINWIKSTRNSHITLQAIPISIDNTRNDNVMLGLQNEIQRAPIPAIPVPLEMVNARKLNQNQEFSPTNSKKVYSQIEENSIPQVVNLEAIFPPLPPITHPLINYPHAGSFISPKTSVRATTQSALPSAFEIDLPFRTQGALHSTTQRALYSHADLPQTSHEIAMQSNLSSPTERITPPPPQRIFTSTSQAEVPPWERKIRDQIPEGGIGDINVIYYSKEDQFKPLIVSSDIDLITQFKTYKNFNFIKIWNSTIGIKKISSNWFRNKVLDKKVYYYLNDHNFPILIVLANNNDDDANFSSTRRNVQTVIVNRLWDKNLSESLILPPYGGVKKELNGYKLFFFSPRLLLKKSNSSQDATSSTLKRKTSENPDMPYLAEPSKLPRLESFSSVSSISANKFKPHQENVQANLNSIPIGDLPEVKATDLPSDNNNELNHEEENLDEFDGILHLLALKQNIRAQFDPKL